MTHSDWIEHDGGQPRHWQSGKRVTLWIGALPETGLRYPQPDETVTPDHPCFHWHWRTIRTGWFKRETVRVCNDPAYAPVVAYRFNCTSKGMKVLQQILRDTECLVSAIRGKQP